MKWLHWLKMQTKYYSWTLQGLTCLWLKDLKKHTQRKKLSITSCHRSGLHVQNVHSNLKKYCDTLLGILPFEIDYYPQKKAQYIGHPLLDEIQLQTEEKEEGTIAFMPGKQKDQKLADCFLFLKKYVKNFQTKKLCSSSRLHLMSRR